MASQHERSPGGAVSARRRARYEFQKFIERGTLAFVGSLAAIAVVIALAAGLAEWALPDMAPSDGRLDPWEAAWQSFLRALDPGTMSNDQGSGYRWLMLFVTLAGVLLVAALTGVMTTWLEAELEKMRRGRSYIVERQHYVILGWSSAVLAIVEELALGAADQGERWCVALLAPRDPLEMQEAITGRLRALARRRPEVRGLARSLRVICRTGSTVSKQDLDLVCLDTAKAVIMVAPEDSETERDGDPVFRTALAVRKVLGVDDVDGEPTRVAELAHGGLPEDLREAGVPRAHQVETDLLMARIIAQSSRQSGLSDVYNELLSFNGNEIYTPAPGTLRTFGEARFAFQAAIPIGFRRQSEDRILLSPADSEPLAEGDRLISVAENGIAAALRRSGPPPAAAEFALPPLLPPHPERLLVVGWNRRGARVLRDLSRYAPPGSTATIVADPSLVGPAPIPAEGPLGNLTIDVLGRDTCCPVSLGELDPSAFQHIIILGYGDCPTMTRGEADTRTLRTLLHLRDHRRKGATLVTEVLDVRNHDLAESGDADDFVVSDRLVSLMLAQVASNWRVAGVVDQLVDPSGSEIYLQPACLYVPERAEVTFSAVAQAAARRQHVAIGWRTGRGGNRKIAINPGWDSKITLQPDDRIIVVAKEQA